MRGARGPGRNHSVRPRPGCPRQERPRCRAVLHARGRRGRLFSSGRGWLSQSGLRREGRAPGGFIPPGSRAQRVPATSHGTRECGPGFERAARDGWVPPPIASAAPWSDTAYPINRDVSDVTRRRVVHRRKLDIGAEIGASKLLKQFRGTSLRDSTAPMDDDVLIEANLVARAGLNGQCDARVTADVSNLPVLGQVRGDDLIAVQADPDDRHLRSSVWLERHQMR